MTASPSASMVTNPFLSTVATELSEDLKVPDRILLRKTVGTPSGISTANLSVSPTGMESVLQLSLTPSSFSDISVTERIHDALAPPAAVTVMRLLPSCNPTTLPSLSTVATSLLDDVHSRPASEVPSGMALTFSCSVLASLTDGFSGSSRASGYSAGDSPIAEKFNLVKSS